MSATRELNSNAIRWLHRIRSTLVVAAAILIGATRYHGAYAGNYENYTASAMAMRSGASASGEAGLANGDTLKISFYEQLGSQSSSSQPMLSAMVEHARMTGDYTVQLNGTIYVPLIGVVKAAGLTPEQLQYELETRSTSLLKRPLTAIVRLIKREPIYVTGSVPGPGVFDYRPGMTVLHAMILAGVRTAGPEITGRIDVLQEVVRLRKSNAILADLIARRDVFVGLRDGKDPEPSSALLNLVGRTRAKRYMRAADRVARLEAGKVKTQEEGFHQASAALERERKVAEQSMRDAETALKHTYSRFKFLSNKRNRGIIITQDQFYQALNSLDASKAGLDQIRASVEQLDERLVELRQKEALTICDAEIVRQRAIDSLNAAITETTITRNSLAPVLASTSTAFGGETAPPKERILRRSPTGIVKLDATELSPLQPGDIVEVIKPMPAPAVEGSASTQTILGELKASSSAMPARVSDAAP